MSLSAASDFTLSFLLRVILLIGCLFRVAVLAAPVVQQPEKPGIEEEIFLERYTDTSSRPLGHTDTPPYPTEAYKVALRIGDTVYCSEENCPGPGEFEYRKSIGSARFLNQTVRADALNMVRELARGTHFSTGSWQDWIARSQSPEEQIPDYGKNYVDSKNEEIRASWEYSDSVMEFLSSQLSGLTEPTFVITADALSLWKSDMTDSMNLLRDSSFSDKMISYEMVLHEYLETQGGVTGEVCLAIGARMLCLDEPPPKNSKKKHVPPVFIGSATFPNSHTRDTFFNDIRSSFPVDRQKVKKDAKVEAIEEGKLAGKTIGWPVRYRDNWIYLDIIIGRLSQSKPFINPPTITEYKRVRSNRMQGLVEFKRKRQAMNRSTRQKKFKKGRLDSQR
ncbi:hypothetical protein EV361DRAFT_893698 [Lentinula raphanica]|nr:hypothetical protein EV361DRAFT_893698 [Lentinula raphanica]